MFGGLHIEKALWSTSGDMLDCSGWTSVLTKATVAKSGTSDLYLKAARITSIKKSQKITALAYLFFKRRLINPFESALTESVF